MGQQDAVIALLVARLGGRQVVTDEEMHEAATLPCEAYRQSDALILEVRLPHSKLSTPRKPLFNQEGEV